MRLLIAAPFLLLLVLFTLSNPQPVRLGLWPTDLTLEAPLSLVVLAAMALAFLAGALMLWFSALAARGRARRAEGEARRLEAQLAALRAQPSQTPAPLSPVLPPPA